MPKRLSLEGQRFGRLVVLQFSHINTSGNACWFCICDCGREVTVTSACLSRGTSSCGCYQKDQTSEACRRDLTGQRFGKWVVLKYSCGTKRKSSTWECLCDCGIRKEVISYSLTSGESTSCGCRSVSNLHEKTREALIKLGYTIEYEEFPVHQQWFSFDDRVSILKVDIIIGTPRGLIAIECNGIQHYEPVAFYKGEEGFRQTQERDKLKKRSLDAMGFPLIIVRYDCKDIEAFLKDELERI